MNKITKWFQSKIPVSRSRYERELGLLRMSVNRTIEEEKHQLDDLINRLQYTEISPSLNGQRYLRTELIVTDDLIHSLRSPSLRNRFFYEIGVRVAKELQRDVFGK